MTTKEKTGKKTERGLQRQRAGLPMSPFDEMERLFEDFGRRGWLHPFQWEWPKEMLTTRPFEGKCPNVDLIDRDKEVVVRAELPGVKKDDLEVTLTDNRVTIRATTRQEEEKEEGEYYRREITRGDFQRTLELPEDVDTEKAKARFRDGVLELTLPKARPAPKQRIRVE